MVQACDEEYDVVQEDLPQAMQLLGEMNDHVKQVVDLVEDMLQKVKSGEMTTEYGLNYLEIKYHMLLDYLINITHVVLRKCSGETIEHDPSIERLIEIRTVLEKIRPIDSKIRYQIDKLVKTAVSGNISSSDPTSFKANPDNFESSAANQNSDDEQLSESEETGNQRRHQGREKSTGKYVPPKLTAMHYDGDETKQERSRKQMERAKKRALGLSIIQDLKEEYLDNPVEISGSSRAQQMLSQSQREKEEYEETYLTRLPVPKVEKQRQRKLTTLGTLGDEITKFGDMSGSSKGSKRKRKGAVGKKGGKKRKFK